MKTLLVAIDLSPASTRVCAAAVKLAQATRARLVLLHVVPPPAVELRAYGNVAASVRGMLAELERRAARRVLALGRRCEKAGLPVEVVQRTGEPVATILDKAQSLRADAIVIGSHGHSAAYDLLVGSTTQRILRRARMPVLVVPQRAGRSR